MAYLVYVVSFVTARGTKRSYVGYTSSLDVRQHWHRKRPPVWMKPAGDATSYQYSVMNNRRYDS